MKAHIGPYINWWGPYQLADLLQKVGVDEDRCYRLGAWLSETWVHNVCQWIHKKRKRNISIKVDKYDSWSADSTIAMLAVPIIKQLRDTKHGIPGRLYEGEEFDLDKIRRYNAILSNEDYSEEGKQQRDKDFAEAEAIWDEIVGEMIFGLEACYVEGHEPDFWIERPTLEFKDSDQPGFRELIHNGKLDHAAYDAYHKRVQNGLVLFGRYFRTLWD